MIDNRAPGARTCVSLEVPRCRRREYPAEEVNSIVGIAAESAILARVRLPEGEPARLKRESTRTTRADSLSGFDPQVDIGSPANHNKTMEDNMFEYQGQTYEYREGQEFCFECGARFQPVGEPGRDGSVSVVCPDWHRGSWAERVDD